MIAMALTREYEMLIADEPFSGLDPKQIATLKALLLEQKEKGKIVLLSSHLLDVTEYICDQYVVIKKNTNPQHPQQCSTALGEELINYYSIIRGENNIMETRFYDDLVSLMDEKTLGMQQKIFQRVVLEKVKCPERS